MSPRIFGKIEQMIQGVCQADVRDYPKIRISLPQDPGQAGLTQKAAYSKVLHGFQRAVLSGEGREDRPREPALCAG